MRNSIIAATASVFSILSEMALAADDNFNTTAYKDGTTTGSTNANCSSAIAWWCDVVESTTTVQAAPGPLLGWAPVIAVALAAAFVAIRRR
ncbi:MAG: hypothetical protein NXI18_20110 [Alphaproteobacteria bacterium]|nr:hypothetical protein [Alphaproteobacteria bacterium]